MNFYTKDILGLTSVAVFSRKSTSANTFDPVDDIFTGSSILTLVFTCIAFVFSCKLIYRQECFSLAILGTYSTNYYTSWFDYVMFINCYF